MSEEETDDSSGEVGKFEVDKEGRPAITEGSRQRKLASNGLEVCPFCMNVQVETSPCVTVKSWRPHGSMPTIESFHRACSVCVLSYKLTIIDEETLAPLPADKQPAGETVLAEGEENPVPADAPDEETIGEKLREALGGEPEEQPEPEG